MISKRISLFWVLLLVYWSFCKVASRRHGKCKPTLAATLETHVQPTLGMDSPSKRMYFNAYVGDWLAHIGHAYIVQTAWQIIQWSMSFRCGLTCCSIRRRCYSFGNISFPRSFIFEFSISVAIDDYVCGQFDVFPRDLFLLCISENWVIFEVVAAAVIFILMGNWGVIDAMGVVI